jgi:hypothetical protein
VLLEEGTALTLGHATPHAELDAVVEGVGTALDDHRAMPADDRGFALCGATDEQLIRVGLSASGLGDPGDSGFSFGLDHTLHRAVSGLGSDCRANYWLCTGHQRSLRHTVSRRLSPPE